MSESELKSAACDSVTGSAQLLASVSRRLWEEPELALEERKAHEMLTETLERQGFSVTRHFVLDTGFKATFSSGADRPHVALMCEYDALPDIGHACGHNLIAESAVGAGIGVKAALEKGLQGRVTVLGTPAEEEKGGKLDMINAGFFEDVDVALMAHPYRLTVPHTEHLSMVSLRATFSGKASHAAGAPWEGANALDAAVTAYQSVSNLRQQMRPSWRVHGIVREGGQRPNIIPDRAVLEYYVRCPNDKELSQLRAKVESCFRAAAVAAGSECQVEETEAPYSSVIPNRQVMLAYTDSLQELGIPYQSESGASGSTDMGNVSYVVPSIHPMFSVGGDAPNHSTEFTRFAGAPEAQPHTIGQSKALALTAIKLMLDPQLLAEARASLQDDLKEYKA